MFDNEVSVLIDGQRFRFWSTITIGRSIDNMDTVDLSGPFDPTDANQREVMRPLTYKPMTVLVNGVVLFTGIMASIVPRVTPDSIEFGVGGYSTPGELSQLPQPSVRMPGEFRRQNLHQIAETLASYYDIGIKTDVLPGPIFKKVKIEPTATVISFLIELAQQRNQVMSSTSDGKLLFWRAVTEGDPVAFLEQGLSPMRGIQPAVNPAEYYSEITGLKPVRPRSKSTVKFTVKNPFLANVYRPYTFDVPDAETGSLKEAVEAKLSRMYANAIAYTVEVATWRDARGDLWAPNKIVRILAPGAMIYRPHDFVIRSVTLDRTPDSETASLDVMMPGSFSSVKAGGLPWDE